MWRTIKHYHAEMLIYRAINKINGKSYVGQTIGTLEQRKAKHLSNARCRSRNVLFENMLVKYGQNGFDWEICCICNSKQEMDEKEKFYIQKYRTSVLFHDCNGYNMTLGGDYNPCYGLYGKNHPAFNCKHSKNSLDKRIQTFKKNYYSGASKSRKGNVRFGDRRSWEEIHGKEKSEKLKSKASIRYTGENNPNSKTYSVKDPDGKEYIVSGRLRKFCIEHNISYGLLLRKKEHKKWTVKML